MGAEPPDVHLPHIRRRLAGDDPLRHQLPDPAGARESVGAEPGRDEQAADVGLAEAELVVGGERLGSVDQPRDAHILHRRHAPTGRQRDLLEPRPILFEQPPVEVRRNPVELTVVKRPRSAAPLVAAHHQPRPLLAEVDQQIGVAQRREVLARGPLPERLRHEVLVRERDDRHADPGHPPEFGREHPAGVDDHLGLDVAPFRSHAPDPAVIDVDSGDPAVREHPASALTSGAAQRVGQHRRVEVAVALEVRSAADAVGHHQREPLLGLGRREKLERQPERLRPRDLSQHLLLSLRGACEPDPAALHPTAVERPVERDRVHHQPRQRDATAQLADEPGGVERRAAGELVPVEQDDIAFAERGQVVRDRRASDAAADDHDPGPVGQLTRTRHPTTPRIPRSMRGARAARSAAPRRHRSRIRARRSRPGSRPRRPRARRT